MYFFGTAVTIKPSFAIIDIVNCPHYHDPRKPLPPDLLCVKLSIFQEVFPVHYGPQYDTALQVLVWEFLSRLEELLPVPDFTQTAAWLGDAPSVVEECGSTIFDTEELKTLLQHHQHHGNLKKSKCPTRIIYLLLCMLNSLSGK
uniref:TERF1-interacting nuclear factor 2 N-terminal domain-containing protein n=1 Tax=Hucho hucho TaxID=62062 RepID=A0A4W5MWX8_9TELE